MARSNMDWGGVFDAGLHDARRSVPPPGSEAPLPPIMLTVAATPALVPFLMERIAPAERAALEAITGGRGAEQLALNIEASTLTWCGIDRDGVVTMGGVFPLGPAQRDPEDLRGSEGIARGTGYVWQVATPALALHKRAYVRQGRAMRTAALAQYQRLTTNIEASYLAALRHVVRLGFDVEAPETMGGTRVCRCGCERGF